MQPVTHSILWCFLVALQAQSLCAVEPAPANQDSWITFLSHRTGENLLYKMRPDGTDCNPIFGGPIQDAPGIGDGMTLYREPHWTWQSPDRKFFASWTTDFTRPRSWRLPFSLQLGRTDGTGATRALAYACEEAVAWSPDSKRLAYVVSTDPASSAHPTPARMSRVSLVAIDGTSKEMIMELPDVWAPLDWSSDGKKLLLHHYQFINWKLGRSDLVELDLARVESVKQVVAKTGRGGSRWQNGQMIREALDPIPAALANSRQGRYSPNGKFIAIVSTTPGRAQADSELGVIDRASGAYRKLMSGPIHGPLCWSPDSTEIICARGLPKGDEREAMKPREGPGRLPGPLDYGLGLFAIKSDGSGERFLTTGWSPDWR